MATVELHDKRFEKFIFHDEIQQSVQRLANTVFEIYKNETPIFVGILSGVVMFISDFLKKYPGNCEVAFLQVASYHGGTQSSGVVKLEIPLTTDIVNRHVVILEDIVDTGNTLEYLYKMLKQKPVKSLRVVSLFFKPGVYKKSLPIDLIGLSIPNEFVVGYGLDYNGLGRNLTDLYKLIPS